MYTCKAGLKGIEVKKVVWSFGSNTFINYRVVRIVCFIIEDMISEGVIGVFKILKNDSSVSAYT